MPDKIKQAMKMVVLDNNLHCSVYDAMNHIFNSMESAIKLGEIDRDFLMACLDMAQDTHAKHEKVHKLMKQDLLKLSTAVEAVIEKG